MEKLIIKNVNKTYKLENKETFDALTDINISFNKGELVSIIGESGSGKSTLMNLIGGLDSDFTGEILVDGVNICGMKDKQLDAYRKNKVGFVFQSFNLIPHLSILDNVTIALTLSNVSKKEREKRAKQMLTLVGLKAHMKKKPNQLSGGQKQRVAIARALINDPEIILADEPTGALDSGTTLQILELLKKIAEEENKLVIMVTHSDKVASVSSRVVEISDGRIVSDKKNPNYSRTYKKTSSNTQSFDKKTKSNLSLLQAIRLSFHNMTASKTKNFLMAFGVGIGIASLIIMMCFSSGITDFITDTMKSYSDPTIASISKNSEDDDSNFSFFSPNMFEDEEITSLIEELNANAGLENEITSEDVNMVLAS